MAVAKSAGLAKVLGASFGSSNPAAAKPLPPAASPAPAAVADDDRPDMKGVVFRMLKSDWKRVRDLSTETEKSIQLLIEEGLNRLFQERGLPPLTGVPRRVKD